jgi:hypothetical protein
MTKLLLLTVILGFSCAHTSDRVKNEPRGYCFKAEGLSKLRCYRLQDTCLERQSTISDQHPWAKIEIECHLDNPPLPGN